MSYPIVISVVTAEAMSLSLLWVALRATISRVLRPLVAGFGLSGAWGAWVLVLVVRGPVWMLAITGSVFAVAAVAMGIAIHLATDEEEGRQGEDGGEAEPVTPKGPSGSGNDEPAWWPEFQRQMTAYAARRARERQPVDR